MTLEPEPREPDNPAAWALARHIADHPVSTIQAAFRYLNAPLTIELHDDGAARQTRQQPATGAALFHAEGEHDRLRAALEEARSWARHGYEIGQRSCTWSDHGVAPAWLTDGWPVHFSGSDTAPAHSCDNCDGVDPSSCLTNPSRAGQPDTGTDAECHDCEHPRKLHDQRGCWGHWGPEEGCTCGYTQTGKTACKGPGTCDGDTWCEQHEREQAHAEGEHAFCGEKCTVPAADRAAILREAAELGRQLSRDGYSAQEIAARLDRMAGDAS